MSFKITTGTFLLIISSLAQVIHAITPNADTLTACNHISSLSIQTYLTNSLDALLPTYVDAQSHYWSAANADLHPACIVFPTTAEEVSQIVATIDNYPDVNFAVKSGGHNPNVGYSSTDGGILISMSNLAATVVSQDLKTADVGPGARWVSVVEALKPYNLGMVSGRLGKFIIIIILC